MVKAKVKVKGKPVASAEVAKSTALIDRIRPILRGHDPATMGVVLGVLTAMWLHGFIEDRVREEVMDEHVDSLRACVVKMRGAHRKAAR